MTEQSMFRIVMREETSLPEFREHARTLFGGKIMPSQVTWTTSQAADLFAGPPPDHVKTSVFTVPSAYVDLARVVLHHRDPARFALLYDLLWRLLGGERMLLSVFSEPLVYRLRQMQKSVERDLHKMTAFLRFRQVEDTEGERYVAWFEPQHLILRPAAEFFIKRFANMRWSILTPDGTLNWDTNRLTTGPAVPKSDAPSDDAMEDWWKSYYSATFNPARVNPGMMRTEMPVRYWKNLPEAALIPSLVAGARRRADRMIDNNPTPPRRVVVRERATPEMRAGTLDALRAEAAACQRCPLFCNATQTVFGEGPEDAPVVFVGEQPGDQEDLAGRPFVGPAGQLFDRALGEAGVMRGRVYVTNAVKHFKFTPRGMKRIHQKPDDRETEHCQWWLDREIGLIKPRLVVALGATAMRALTGKTVRITGIRGQLLTGRDGRTLLGTVHPAYLLRLPDPTARASEYRNFVEDLTAVARFLPEIARAA
jgi:DNA polymerase